MRGRETVGERSACHGRAGVKSEDRTVRRRGGERRNGGVGRARGEDTRGRRGREGERDFFSIVALHLHMLVRGSHSVW